MNLCECVKHSGQACRNRGRQSAQPPSRQWSNTVIWGQSRPPRQGSDLAWLGFFVGPVPATPHTPAQPLSTAWTPLMHTRAYAEAGVGVMCTSTRWRRPPLSARDKRQHIEGRCSTPALGGPNRPSAARPLVIAARRGLLPQWVAARRRWSHRRSTFRPALPPPLPLGRRRSI